MADLAAMKKAGIAGAIFLEVNIGIPRGSVDFMSQQWQELFADALHEADRLGIQIALGSGRAGAARAVRGSPRNWPCSISSPAKPT